MSWTQDEITSFKSYNANMIAEINATLRPDNTIGEKIGVALPGQAGDIGTAMSVLKYRKEVFPDKQIIWFCNYPNADMLRYATINEVRMWPWAGNYLPVGTPDFWPLLGDGVTPFNKELAKQYELTEDISMMYFPAPYMTPVQFRHGISYSNVSKKIFGIPDNYQWHPYLLWSDEERKKANEFINKIGSGKKVIIESFAGSGQSRLNKEMISTVMNKCSEYWPDCNFIFASHKFLRDEEKFPEYLFQQPNVYSCADFTVRQCALIVEKSDLMISVSSGITVASSAWDLHPPPTLQFCGSIICSTVALANGQFELVTADDKPFDLAKEQFYTKLIELLKKI